MLHIIHKKKQEREPRGFPWIQISHQICHGFLSDSSTLKHIQDFTPGKIFSLKILRCRNVFTFFIDLGESLLATVTTRVSDIYENHCWERCSSTIRSLAWDVHDLKMHSGQLLKGAENQWSLIQYSLTTRVRKACARTGRPTPKTAVYRIQVTVWHKSLHLICCILGTWKRMVNC